MSKVVLILDEKPAKCLVCNFRGIRDCHCCFAENASIPRIIDDIYSRPDWCPLHTLPEAKAYGSRLYHFGDEYVDGWNACLAAIKGEEDEIDIHTG